MEKRTTFAKRLPFSQRERLAPREKDTKLALASPFGPKGEASAKGEGHEVKKVSESSCVSPNYD
ncbi:hypothetical protein N9414_11434 [Nodularia spumigena CCY9414]|nr:hypothetical protein N9414_11434 [Nodularia spumigena CCY9414]